MLVATFNATTGWAGKTITYEEGVFSLDEHGAITPADLLRYDDKGQVSWAYEGLREWVQQLAGSTPAAPQARFAAGAPAGRAQAGPAGSHLVRNVIIAAAAVIVLIVIIAAIANTPSSTTATSGGSGTTSEGSGTTSGGSGTQAKAGPVGSPFDYADDSGSAVVTLVSVNEYAQPKDTTMGQAPQNGAYAVCYVEIRCTKGTYDYNPNYFKYQSPNGSAYEYDNGNAMFAGYGPELESGTLTAGQNTRGTVTFDVAGGAAGALVQLMDPLDDVVFQWRR